MSNVILDNVSLDVFSQKNIYSVECVHYVSVAQLDQMSIPSDLSVPIVFCQTLNRYIKISQLATSFASWGKHCVIITKDEQFKTLENEYITVDLMRAWKNPRTFLLENKLEKWKSSSLCEAFPHVSVDEFADEGIIFDQDGYVMLKKMSPAFLQKLVDNNVTDIPGLKRFFSISHKKIRKFIDLRMPSLEMIDNNNFRDLFTSKS